MLIAIRNWLIDPKIRELDVDSSDITIIHREILKNKYMLRKLFEKFYSECYKIDKQYLKNCHSEKRLEIGSGSSFIKDIYPDIITSDIKPLPFTDLVCDASNLPFEDESLRAIYGINVFHHLPNPRAFFDEAQRVLSPGGGIILIEPYYGQLARLLFANLHASEGFDMNVTKWEMPITGPMSNANQALSYVVFKRDMKIFNEEYPQLEIVLDRPHTHMWYLLSGGVNFRQLAPNIMTRPIELFEKIMSPLNHWTALQHTILVRKKN